MIHDRQHYLARWWITYLLHRALGDLFFGPYSIFIEVLKLVSLPEPLAIPPIRDGVSWVSVHCNELVQVQCALHY